MVSFVLIHGGSFAGSCWHRVVPLLPPPVLAVDLPGRGARARPTEGIRIADFVEAVVEDIEAAGLDDVVLVGHSMAGVTLPGVMALVPERLRHVVFVACTVPAEGERIVDTLPDDLDTSDLMALFCNDMDEARTEETRSLQVSEAAGVVTEPVSLTGLSVPVPRTWVRLERDLIIPPERQDLFAARVGARVVPLDAGHMAMLSAPAELARILREIAGL